MTDRPQPKQGYIDNLRLSVREQEQLLAELDQEGQRYHGSNRRTDDRTAYRAGQGIVIQMRHPGGSSANYVVAPRNLSRGGLGFLHGSFVYTGTACIVVLKTRGGKAVRVEGKVANCRYLRGHVHEVGIRFHEPLRLADFLPPSALGEDGDAGEALPELRGSVLYIEDSVDDQELVTFILTSVGAQVRTAGNGIEGLELALHGQFDVIITDVQLPGINGPNLAADLRRQGFHGPIFALTADESPAIQAEAMAKGCTGILHKPCRSEELVGVLAPYLAAPAGGAAGEDLLLSARWANQKMRPLILTYLGRMESHVREIGQLLRTDERDVAVLRKLCLDIKGSAGGYGYPQISAAAQGLLDLALEPAPAQDVRAQFQELTRLCTAANRVRQQSGPGG